MTSTTAELLRLVHVDDSQETLNSIARLARRRGWLVAKCHNVAEAMAALNKPPNLLLVDLALDGENGLDVVTAARALYPDLEIVVLAGSDPEEVGPRCRKAGASRVLNKATSIDTILTPAPAGASASPPEPAPLPLVLPLRTVVDRYIFRAVEIYHGNLTQAAEALEIGLNTLKRHLTRVRED